VSKDSRLLRKEALKPKRKSKSTMLAGLHQ
jgi:hypothetical protein